MVLPAGLAKALPKKLRKVGQRDVRCECFGGKAAN